MKQVLLLAMIHLLIFHQYSKDKKERLSPQKTGNEIKSNANAKRQNYMLTAFQNANDSLFSWHAAPIVYGSVIYTVPSLHK